MPATLIALSNPADRESLTAVLRQLSRRVTQASSYFEARRWLRSGVYDLLFTEERLPDGLGRRLARDSWATVLVEGADSQRGDVPPPDGFVARIAPPFQVDRLRVLVQSILGDAWLSRAQCAGAPVANPDETPLVGDSEAIRLVQDRIERVAKADAPVLITGETGTGKELAARAVHRFSRRSAKPFVALNCGAISPSLVESQLFGHERGSFTGATRRHRGVFERADGGTLFLDEITETPRDLQVKLLRVLETGEFHRTGGEEAVSVDVRTIAATNRDVQTSLREGRLRKDLYYRLQVLQVSLPPLRDRSDDVLLLAKTFLAQIAEAEGRNPVLAEETLACLARYPWPGNVRELRNAMLTAYVHSDRTWIPPSALPPEIQLEQWAPRNPGSRRRWRSPTPQFTPGPRDRGSERPSPPPARDGTGVTGGYPAPA